MKPGERIDDLQRNGLRIIQDPSGFCFGVDAVLLSDFAGAGAGDRVVDLCTGTGVIPLLLSAKTAAFQIIGLEIQDKAVDMAKRSVLLNGLCERISVIKGDVKEASTVLGRGSFDVVTANPPYLKSKMGLINADDSIACARHEILMSLEDLARETAALLKQGGRFYMIHKTFRLPEIITVLRDHKLEPKRMRLIHPYGNKESNLVMIEARKGGGMELHVMPPLIMYEEKGVYSREIHRIYDTNGWL